jgi:hypothetical protein
MDSKGLVGLAFPANSSKSFAILAVRFVTVPLQEFNGLDAFELDGRHHLADPYRNQ